MNFKILNITVNLPEKTTAEQAAQIEADASNYLKSKGYSGSASFDTSSDIGVPSPAPNPTPAPKPAMASN